MEDTKTCSTCGETKSITEYRAGGNQCKKCRYKKGRGWALSHRDRNKEIHHNSYIKHRVLRTPEEKEKNYKEGSRKRAETKKTIKAQHTNEVEKLLRSETCEILKIHKEILSDDPEHLPTEFIKKLISKEDICPDVKE